MTRILMTLLVSLFLTVPLAAQEAVEAPQTDRSATGGAQTLDDILARQRGEKIDDSFRSEATGDPDNAAGIANQLGTLGGISDSEVWRALRYGLADVKVSTGGAESRVLIQDGGMTWLEFRRGPLAQYGAYLLGGTIVLLALFFLLRGRIRIDGEKTGRTVTRFQAVERFGHWLMAGAFVVLGITGLITLFGRKVLIPAFGHEMFSTMAIASKWVHNNISWAFMIGLVMVFFMWVMHNIPNKTDLKWLAVGGGIFKKGVHPPAKKFNAGQKLIFWSA
ncbi:MAG: cytochrome b/b6 domain-containing protein, partial [Roseovarius sp.]|nr:cytochrome b/b6 domain-containing protein [Roseovarius sp.]